MRYFFHPWIESTTPRGGIIRRPPPGAQLVFNFKGRMPLFRANEVPPASANLVLGEGPERKANLAVVRRALGDGLDVMDGRVLDVVFRLMAFNGDPTGKRMWKPIKPALRTGCFDFYVPGEGRVVQRFNTMDHELVLNALKQDYREIRANGKGPEHLWAWERRLGLRPRDVTPEDLSLEVPKRPRTVHTESFSCVQSGENLSCDQQWRNLWGDHWKFNGSRAGIYGSFGDPQGEPCRCNSPVLSDHHVSLFLKHTSVSGSGGQSQTHWGVTVRHSGSGTTDDLRRYAMRIFFDGHVEIWENNAQFTEDYTLLQSGNLPGAPAPNYFAGFDQEVDPPAGPMHGVAEGSRLSLWYQGEEIISVTDSTFSSQTRGGLDGDGNNFEVDDWAISDEFPIGANLRRSQAVIMG